MIFGNIFDEYAFVPESAADFGFTQENGGYTIRRPLDEEGFYAVFRITEGCVEVNVYEEPGEIFLPFNTDADGGFVQNIRAQAGAVLDDILQKCFVRADIKSVLLGYAKEKYGTIPEAPWGYLKEYHTLNTAKRHKWYGLFMLIPYKYLGLEKEGKVHVLNLKVKPEDIPALIDNRHYFPSYHMNKKYWISILLDRSADIEQIKKLLDDSYAIVEGNTG